jgi:hypothetical protein
VTQFHDNGLEDANYIFDLFYGKSRFCLIGIGDAFGCAVDYQLLGEAWSVFQACHGFVRGL